MKFDWTLVFMLMNTIILVGVVVLGIMILFLIVKALLKYINTNNTLNQKSSENDCEENASLGEKLKYYRQKNNFSQEYIAETLGVTRQAVSKWENNASMPSTNNLMQISKLYSISADMLFKKEQVRRNENEF